MNKTYIPAIIILAIVFILHYIGIDNHLYIRFPGYDIMMHILGGAGIAFSLFWFIKTWKSDFDSKKTFLIVLLGTIFLGLLWEVLEGVYDITGAPLWTDKYWIDTIKDIINDTLGMLIAYFLIRK